MFATRAYRFILFSLLVLLILAPIGVRSTGPFLAGATASFLVLSGIRRLTRLWQSDKEQFWKAVWFLALLSSSLTASLLFLRTRGCAPIHPLGPPALLLINRCSMRLDPLSSSLRTLTVDEEVEVDPKYADHYLAGRAAVIRQPRRRLTTESRGPFLLIVTLAPPEEDRSGNAVERFPDGSTGRPLIFWYPRTRSTVEWTLSDIPRGAFFSARNAIVRKRSPYFDRETVQLASIDPSAGVTIALLRPPANAVRSLVTPFLSLWDFGVWLFWLLGIGIGVVASTVMKPAFGDLAKRAIASAHDALTKVRKAPGPKKDIEQASRDELKARRRKGKRS